MYLAWCFTIAFLIVLLTEELTDDESDAIEFIDKPRLSRERRIYNKMKFFQLFPIANQICVRL